MKRKGQQAREQIIDAANRLFYQKGYNQTSFTDVADAAGLPRGNFYYYFRSKDDILDAVIDARMQAIAAMLAEWERDIPEPRDRLHRYVNIMLNEQDDVLRYGCPMGSLNVELGKTQLAQQSRAAEMFDLFLDWLKRQFQALGYGRSARDQALHLLAMTQGGALISNVYSDGRFLKREVARIQAWVDAL